MKGIKKATLRPRKVALREALQHFKYTAVLLVFAVRVLPFALVLIAYAVKAVLS